MAKTTNGTNIAVHLRHDELAAEGRVVIHPNGNMLAVMRDSHGVRVDLLGKPEDVALALLALATKAMEEWAATGGPELTIGPYGRLAEAVTP